MWEAKVIAAAAVDAAVETNWKHIVTPHWGDLKTEIANFDTYWWQVM